MVQETPTGSAEQFMRLALRLARRGRGSVEPNPMVGAVLVQGDKIRAKGWHRRFGGPHAEVELLRDCVKVGINPAQGDLYVTLEPCCHHGKTPPCVEALFKAGVKRVCVAMPDPNPAVAGRGIAQLRHAGVAVEVGLCGPEAQSLNEAYIKQVTTGLPWVIGKWAQTVDGKVATATGESRWISGPESRRWVHQLRGRVDAVMVGIGTVLADDPQLTARGPGVTVRRLARRVVVDPRLRTPPDAQIMKTSNTADVTLAVGVEMLTQRRNEVEAFRARGVEVVGLPMWTGRHRSATPQAHLTGCVVGEGRGETPGAGAGAGLDLSVLMKHLANTHAATNVLVEGGPRLMGSLLRQDLVDQLYVFTAGKIIGDEAAKSAVTGLSIAKLSQATALRLRSVRRLSNDALMEFAVEPVQADAVA